MEVTEVRIKLMEEASERLQAFCSITFDDCFVVRDLKIIEGTSGPFVAMPSRRLTAHCSQCGCKNHLRAAYCNQCGQRLAGDRAVKDDEGRAKLYADIAHPINSACREMIQEQVIRAYREELHCSKLPDYVCSYDDFDDDLAPPARGGANRSVADRKRGQEKQRPAAETAAPLGEKTKLEPPEAEPRAPHRTTAQPSGDHSSAPAKRSGFGDGIL